jgi:hypothetical protein
VTNPSDLYNVVSSAGGHSVSSGMFTPSQHTAAANPSRWWPKWFCCNSDRGHRPNS